MRSLVQSPHGLRATEAGAPIREVRLAHRTGGPESGTSRTSRHTVRGSLMTVMDAFSAMADRLQQTAVSSSKEAAILGRTLARMLQGPLRSCPA